MGCRGAWCSSLRPGPTIRSRARPRSWESEAGESCRYGSTPARSSSPRGSPKRSIGCGPRGGGCWRSSGEPAPPRPGSTIRCGSTWTGRTARPPSRRPGNGGIWTGWSSPTPWSGTPTRCCASPRSAPPSCSGTRSEPRGPSTNGRATSSTTVKGRGSTSSTVRWNARRPSSGSSCSSCSPISVRRGWRPGSRAGTRQRAGSSAQSRAGRASRHWVCRRRTSCASGTGRVTTSSSAEVGEVRWLRIVVMSPTTDDATIEGLLGAIERLAPGLD
jgi:hypothetical protein